MGTPSQKLIQGLTQLGFSEPQLTELADKMDKYIRELILFNSAYNLVNTDIYDEIAVKHILDSLAAAPVITKIMDSLKDAADGQPQTVSVGDIGSGGGLPGIPLAAAFPQHNFSLVERMDKRCAFLENAAAVLKLSNVTVIKAEAERMPPQSFDITTFRAFRPLDEKITKALLSLTKKGGILAAYKAKLSSIKTEMESIKDIIPEYTVEPLSVPFLTESNEDGGRERNIVIIKRI